MKRRYFNLLFATLIITFVIPVFILPINGINSNLNTPPQLNEEYPDIHKVILYTTGTLGNIISSDVYHFQLKENVTYIFWAKIKISEGTFILGVTGDGGADAEMKSWDSNDPDSDRVITFIFTPTDTGDHIITIGTIVATDGGSYSLYVNKDGFAGWWWMLAAGIGALVVLILLIALFVKAFKPKKKKGKRR